MSKLLSEYAQHLGMTSADGHITRNIHLSVADCRHIKRILQLWIDAGRDCEQSDEWSRNLVEYLRGAV